MTGLFRDNFKMKSLFTQIFAMGYVFIQEDTILNFLAKKNSCKKSVNTLKLKKENPYYRVSRTFLI